MANFSTVYAPAVATGDTLCNPDSFAYGGAELAGGPIDITTLNTQTVATFERDRQSGGIYVGITECGTVPAATNGGVNLRDIVIGSSSGVIRGNDTLIDQVPNIPIDAIIEVIVFVDQFGPALRFTVNGVDQGVIYDLDPTIDYCFVAQINGNTSCVTCLSVVNGPLANPPSVWSGFTSRDVVYGPDSFCGVNDPGSPYVAAELSTPIDISEPLTTTTGTFQLDQFAQLATSFVGIHECGSVIDLTNGGVGVNEWQYSNTSSVVRNNNNTISSGAAIASPELVDVVVYTDANGDPFVRFDRAAGSFGPYALDPTVEYCFSAKGNINGCIQSLGVEVIYSDMSCSQSQWAQ